MKTFAWFDAIDPRKVAVWLSIIAAIAGAIASGQLPLDQMIGASAAPFVIAWSKAIAIIMPLIIAAHSGQDLATTKTISVAKALIGFLIISAALTFAAPAFAGSAGDVWQGAPRPKPAIAQGPITPESVATAIQNAAMPDLTYAIKRATAVNTLQSGVRLECFQAMQTAITPPGGDLGPIPDPGLVSRFEIFAELVDALQPTSPVYVRCAGAAQLAKLSVLQFISAVVTGAAGIAILAPR